MADDNKTTALGWLRNLLGKKKPAAPEPAPAPTPEPPTPSYLKILLALRGIPVQKLGPLLFTVPVIVFLAISGAVAWLAVGLGVVMRIVRLVSGL